MSERGRPLIIDASAILDFLLQLRQAPRIGELITDPLAQLHAPETVDREVVSVLRRREQAGDLRSADADEVVHDFVSLPLELYPSRPYFHHVWELRAFISVGDAYYVALTEALEATLLTRDKRMARGLALLDLDVVVP